MADNVTLPLTGTGTATPVFATDDAGGVHYQYVKLADGTADSTAKIAGDATNGLDAIEFEPFEIMQTVWRPYTEWQLRGYNLTPVQSAYNNINMLAYGDDYNQHAFTDNMPNGILNLGTGFDKDGALEWREVWRQELKNPEQNKISLLW